MNKDGVRKELKEDFEANLLDGDAIQDGGQMLSSHYVFEWVERAFPRYAALQADKAVQDALERPAPQEEVSGKQADNRCAICERPATTKYEGIESCGRPSCEYQIQEGIDALNDIGAK